MKDKSLLICLKGYVEDTRYLFPVFFNALDEEALRKSIGDRKKFGVEGFEKATNYQRVQNRGRKYYCCILERYKELVNKQEQIL